jgi:hypothetical protein
MNWPSSHLCIPLHSFKHLVMTFASDKTLGPGLPRTEGPWREYSSNQSEEVLSAGIPTIHGTAFFRLSIVYIWETSEWCITTQITIWPECWYSIDGCTCAALQVVMLSPATVDSNPCNNHASPLFSKSVSVSSMPLAHFVLVGPIYYSTSIIILFFLFYCVLC